MTERRVLRPDGLLSIRHLRLLLTDGHLHLLVHGGEHQLPVNGHLLRPIANQAVLGHLHLRRLLLLPDQAHLAAGLQAVANGHQARYTHQMRRFL